MKHLHELLFILLLFITPLVLAQEDTIDDAVVEEFGTFKLVVNETEVSQVLEMLAIQSKKTLSQATVSQV